MVFFCVIALSFIITFNCRDDRARVSKTLECNCKDKNGIFPLLGQYHQKVDDDGISDGINADTSRPICHLLSRILPIDTTCRSVTHRTTSSESQTDHDDRRRRRARTGRRDDDKRETKGRRHPPGYIPDAL